MKLSSKLCNNSETDECLPWSGVLLSAHVSEASEEMGEWVRTEPRRWRWWPSALSRWPPVSADDLSFIFIRANEKSSGFGWIWCEMLEFDIVEIRLSFFPHESSRGQCLLSLSNRYLSYIWSVKDWPLYSARRLCLALRCSSSTHLGRVDGKNTFLCRCHEAW